MTLGTTLQVPAEMWPADREAFDEYWQAVARPGPHRRRRARLSVADRGGPARATPRCPRPLQRALDAVNLLITTGFLPQRFRDEMRLPWDAAKQRRFDRVMAVVGRVNNVMPRFVRQFPFNWC